MHDRGRLCAHRLDDQFIAVLVAQVFYRTDPGETRKAEPASRFNELGKPFAISPAGTDTAAAPDRQY